MLPSELESIAEEAQERFRAAVVADEDGSRLPNLLAVEEAVVAFTQQLGLGLVEVFVDVREQQAKTMRGPCSCGARPELHRRTTWTRQSPFGPVRVGDPYVYCRSCQSSARPFYAWLGTERETWSAQERSLGGGQRGADRLTSVAPRTPVPEISEFIHRRGPPRTAERTRVRRYHSSTLRLSAALCGKLVRIERSRGPQSGSEPGCTQVKAGLVQIPGKLDRLYSLRPTGALDAAFSDLFSLACMEGWTETTAVRGIADGAVHIRQRMEENFGVGDFRFILDRPHAKEHLSSAGQALERITKIPPQQWATDAMSRLEGGQAHAVVRELEDAHMASGSDDDDRDDTLRLEAGYFRRNADAVVYAQYRAAGWSTASSEIESAHRHIVQSRLKIAGAWWDPAHVDDILALRMLKANGWWDEYWQHRRRDWRRRADTLAEARHSHAA